MEEAINIRFDDRRAFARTHDLQSGLCGQMNRQRIHTIDFPCRNAEPKTPRRQPDFARHLLHFGGNRIAVVFDKEHNRQRPCSRQIHRLERGPDIDRPIAKIGDGDIASARPLMRHCRARSQGHTAAHNRIGSKRARIRPAQMHRATAAMPITGFKPHNLCQTAI